jgi:hypothetical protein
MVEIVRRRKTAETIHHRLAHSGKHKVGNYEAEVTTHPMRTVHCVYNSGSQNQWGGQGGQQNEAGESRDDRGEY